MIIVDGVEKFPHITKAIALSHTGFNIVNVMLLTPFTVILANLLMRFMPDKTHKEIPKLKFLDVRMLDTPAIGIQQSQREILRMGELVRKMLTRLKSIIINKSRDELAETKIFRREEIIDLMQKEIMSTRW